MATKVSRGFYLPKLTAIHARSQVIRYGCKVQVIRRQAFTGDPSTGNTLVGNPFPPDPNEIGWKETVRMNPGDVTTVIMKFDLPGVPFVVPSSPRTGGNEYVWHCHILEHEDNEMMRPYDVVV